MPKLVAVMRVKDGTLFLEQWLASIEQLVDEIIIVDNGSTDGTLERLKIHPKVTSLDETVGFHQGRDDNLLHQRARERHADWIVYLDVDEMFERRITRDHLDRMMADAGVNQYWFRRFHLHGDIDHFEAGIQNLWSTAKPDRLMWRDRPAIFFPNEMIHVFPGGFDEKNKTSPFRIRHFGTINRDYLVRKTDAYLAIDPGRAAMYIKHRDQQLPRWRWYEFDANPMRVRLQLFVLDVFWGMRIALRRWKKIRHGAGKIYRSFAGPRTVKS